MKRLIMLFVMLCFIFVFMIIGCTRSFQEASQYYPNGMNDIEKSKVQLKQTDLGDRISFFDEEIEDTYEMNLLKSTSFDSSKKAALYLIQGSTFNETQLEALKNYLDSNASQTLLAIINHGNDITASKNANQDFVTDAEKYQNFIIKNVLGWICENYIIDKNDLCYVGYNTAGYFATYLLHTNNPIQNYLIINPELQKKTDRIDIQTREESFFTEGKKSLDANICLLRSEDDKKTLAFTKTDQWINALTERSYKGLDINNEIMAGSGHNVIACESLLRGICYFNKSEYSDRESACIVASKAMTQKEKESITVGKLSKEHEFYNEVIGIDKDCAEYIHEITVYDEEIDDYFVIHASLPPNYDKSNTYPLILMTDGIWRLSDHPELRKLMISEKTEEVILVSVGYPNDYDYTKIRERDFLMKPDLYLQFLVENLIPYLYEHYSVDNTRTTLTGHSYGGYWGLYALFHSDTIGKDIFKYYYIGSPSFQVGTNSVFANDFESWFYERNKNLNCSVYITAGGDEEKHFIDLIEKNIDKIEQHDYEGLKLEYEVIDGYNHNTVFKPSIRNTLTNFFGINVNKTK